MKVSLELRNFVRVPLICSDLGGIFFAPLHPLGLGNVFHPPILWLEFWTFLKLYTLARVASEFNFLQAQKTSKNMNIIFASLNKLKKHGFNFLQA